MAARRRQVVSQKSEPRDVILWRLEHFQNTGSSHHIDALAVDQFPRIFPNSLNSSKVRDDHRKKASRWCKGREIFINQITSTENSRMFVISRNSIGIERKRFLVKAMKGRGRKR